MPRGRAIRNGIRQPPSSMAELPHMKVVTAVVTATMLAPAANPSIDPEFRSEVMKPRFLSGENSEMYVAAPEYSPPVENP
jgi:hypothetical protein